MDIGSKKAMLEDRDKELSKPLETFCTINHMVLFGRPLWSTYEHEDASTIQSLAIAKLLCNKEFDATKAEHVLAVLSARVCLDPCLQNKASVRMTTDAVNSNLRLILRMDDEFGIIDTMSPSEPILSEAVAAIMSNRKRYPEHTWINTLVNSLLSPGVVDRGTCGELAARILCILARDHLLAAQDTTALGFARPFTVMAFLQSLFSDDVFDSIQKSLQPKTVEIMGGTLNFTHFATTTTSLATATMLDLLSTLIREQTALQLRGGQTSWDLLIPVYMGDRAKKFDRTALTAILIQVKNQAKSVVLEDTKYDLSWNQKAYPLIIFQMELGKPESKSNRGRRQVGFIPVQSQFENVVYFKVVGRDTKVFSCLNKSSARAIRQLLNLPMTGQEIQNTHNQHMDRYQVHDLNRRFPPLGVPLPQKHTISETEQEHDQEAKSAHKKKKKLMTIKKSEADDEEGKKDLEDKKVRKEPDEMGSKNTLQNRKSANTHDQETEKNAEEDEAEQDLKEKGVKNKKLKLRKASDQTKNKKAGKGGSGKEV